MFVQPLRSFVADTPPEIGGGGIFSGPVDLGQPALGHLGQGSQDRHLGAGMGPHPDGEKCGVLEFDVIRGGGDGGNAHVAGDILETYLHHGVGELLQQLSGQAAIGLGDDGAGLPGRLHERPGVPLDHFGEAVEYGLLQLVARCQAVGVGPEELMVLFGQRVEDGAGRDEYLLIVHQVVALNPGDGSIGVGLHGQDKIFRAQGVRLVFQRRIVGNDELAVVDLGRVAFYPLHHGRDLGLCGRRSFAVIDRDGTFLRAGPDAGEDGDADPVQVGYVRHPGYARDGHLRFYAGEGLFGRDGSMSVVFVSLDARSELHSTSSLELEAFRFFE